MLRVLTITKQVGINVRGGFIFGDSAESLDSAMNTMRWIEEHVELLENVSISPIVLYPGSQLYNRAVSKGVIKDTEEFIKQGCPLRNVSNYMSDEEYNRLVNYIIPEFSAGYRQKIAKIHVEKLHEEVRINETRSMYSHRYICKKCGNEDIRNIYPGSLFQYHIVCKKCNEKYDLFPNYVFFMQHEEEISDILKEEGTVIWGAGETAQVLYNCNDFFKNSDIPVYDSNLYKQKQGFYGKKVLDPDEIDAAKVKRIVCCVGNVNYQFIRKLVNEKRMGIKVVLINEILLEA